MQEEREGEEVIELQVLPTSQQFFNPIVDEQEEIVEQVVEPKNVSKRMETIRRMPSSFPVKRKFRSKLFCLIYFD